MDPNGYDQAITEAEQQISALTTEMEEIADAFVKASVEFLRDWYESEAKRLIRADPEATRKAGAAKLAQAKRDVADLKAQTDELTKAALDNDALWIHRREPSKNDRRSYWAHGRRPPEIFARAFAELHGHLGRIMISHALGGEQLRRQIDTRGETYRYNWSPDWSDELVDLLEAYRQKSMNLTRALHNLETAKRKRAEAIAENLWNDA